MRKELLPKWIRFFAWIHLCFFMAPLVFLTGLTGLGEVRFPMFGLSYEGMTSLHPVAAIITILTTLSAVVAYGILWGKNWALRLGIIYGWIGLTTCGIAFLLNLNTGTINLPVEILLLAPFIKILGKNKKSWMEYETEINGNTALQKNL